MIGQNHTCYCPRRTQRRRAGITVFGGRAQPRRQTDQLIHSGLPQRGGCFVRVCEHGVGCPIMCEYYRLKRIKSACILEVIASPRDEFVSDAHGVTIEQFSDEFSARHSHRRQ